MDPSTDFEGIATKEALLKAIGSRTGRPPAVDMKFSYAMKFLSQNKSVCFSDNDVFWVQHPAEMFPQAFDGLSDGNGPHDSPDAWTLNVPGSEYCGVEYGETDHGSPCWSTGLWRAQPLPDVLALFQRMVQHLVGGNSEWEQRIFNLQMQQFRNNEGHGTEFNTASKALFCNMGVCEERFNLGLPAPTGAYHLGFIHGREKEELYKELGLWSPAIIVRPEHQPSVYKRLMEERVSRGFVIRRWKRPFLEQWDKVDTSIVTPVKNWWKKLVATWGMRHGESVGQFLSRSYPSGAKGVLNAELVDGVASLYLFGWPLGGLVVG